MEFVSPLLDQGILTNGGASGDSGTLVELLVSRYPLDDVKYIACVLILGKAAGRPISECCPLVPSLKRVPWPRDILEEITKLATTRTVGRPAAGGGVGRRFSREIRSRWARVLDRQKAGSLRTCQTQVSEVWRLPDPFSRRRLKDRTKGGDGVSLTPLPRPPYLACNGSEFKTRGHDGLTTLQNIFLRFI
jgi:hypothetical protein